MQQVEGMTQWGNPNGNNPIPEEAREEDITKPDHVIGTGTPESCTSEAFIKAVAQGGTIVFNGGDKPFTITLDRTAKIFNNANPDVVIDGGGLVTLSGGGKHRILYMNTADPNQVWTTDHAQNQDHPRLTVQNITFAQGNSSLEKEYDGGGAIWVRGGRFKVVNCKFINNQCAQTGADVGGGAIRVFDQYNDLPVFVVNSTFGGAPGFGNIGSNGGAISSIGVSWRLINCLFSYNEAVGNGGNPAKKGTLGGGSGGAIYNDGNTMTLSLEGTQVLHNKVNAYGSGIFFVTNDHTGDIMLDNAVIKDNLGGSWYPSLPNISMHSDTKVTVTTTVYEPKPVTAPATLAMGTMAKVYVDQKEISFEAYHIDGNNYFKLRDIAQVLNGSPKQIEIVWNSTTQTIEITSNKSYTAVGGELVKPLTVTPQTYRLTYPSILQDGTKIELTAYNIKGNNYFKLRDMGKLFSFGVFWDSVQGVIKVDTKSE